MTESLDPMGELVRCLELDTLDRDLFLGDPGRSRGDQARFGGLVAAQSVVAAGRTVESGRTLHSLHAYFLRPGSYDTPLRFLVHRIRDGRSFTTRRVVAHQNGEAIFSMAASFSIPEEGIEHQDEMPTLRPPEECKDWDLYRSQRLGHEGVLAPSAIEVRMLDPIDPVHPSACDPQQQSWLRCRGPLPNDPLLHTAALVYATDRALLSTAIRPHAIPWNDRMVASLDHSVWLHRQVTFDQDWFLYTSESPAARSARGLNFGAIYARNGIRIASVAQEGLVRRRRSR